MVKSKKMSKTGIAVIVLALLLVLSMVMGLTGAWFTAKDQTANQGAKVLKFGNVEVAVEATMTVNNAVDIMVDDDEDPSTPDVYSYTALVAGSGVNASIAYTNSSDVDAYYVIVKLADNVHPYWYVAEEGGVKVLREADTAHELLATETVSFSFTIATDKDYTDKVTINGVEYTIEPNGQVAAQDLLNGIYEIRAIQKDNIGTPAAAFAELTANWSTNGHATKAHTQA